MTLRHIRIFAAVCEAGCNTTKAAEHLHMTQPAVSLAISELENYYGVKLFDRIARRLYISEAGVRFLEYSKSIMLTFDDMEKTVRDWDEKGVVRVGASISIGSKLMPAYAAEFRKSHPETKLTVRIDRSAKLEKALEENLLDIALIEGIVHDANLYSEDYMEDRLAVIVKPELYGDNKIFSAEEFLGMDFLLREKGSGTREIFEASLSSKSYPLPDPVWESLSTAALVNAAQNGLGAAVVPRRMVEDRIAAGDVEEIFVNGLDFSRKYKIVYHKDKKLTKSASEFLGICRKSADI